MKISRLRLAVVAAIAPVAAAVAVSVAAPATAAVTSHAAASFTCPPDVICWFPNTDWTGNPVVEWFMPAQGATWMFIPADASGHTYQSATDHYKDLWVKNTDAIYACITSGNRTSLTPAEYWLRGYATTVKAGCNYAHP